MVAGALSYSCGTRMLPRLRGIMRRMPLLGVGFCVAAMAITGIPPFNGFFSKFPLFAAGFELSSAHGWMLPVMILIAGGIRRQLRLVPLLVRQNCTG